MIRRWKTKNKHCDRNRHQHRGRELERIAVPASKLAGCELRHALRQRGETRALRGDDEVRELVPRSLEREDEERDERRPRHRQHDRPVDAEDAGAVDPRGLLDADGDRLEEVLHDEDAGGVDEERDDHAVVRVVDPELADHQELRDQEHDAGDRHHGDDRREGGAASAEAQSRERVAREAVEEDPQERDAERDDHRVLDPDAGSPGPGRAGGTPTSSAATARG